MPSDFEAPCGVPAAIETTSVSPDADTGICLFTTVLSPSWPYPLYPQAQTEPSDFRATVWY